MSPGSCENASGAFDPPPGLSGALDHIASADVVVIGAGAAGMRTALGCAGRRVILLTAGALGEAGASLWAQGGVAAALGPGDSATEHAADTCRVADGLADPRAVDLLVTQAGNAVETLVSVGARFTADSDGTLCLGQEGGHRRARVVHAADATGAEIIRALRAAVVATPSIVVQVATARSLLKHNGRTVGVLACGTDGAWWALAAPVVVLATGGAGGLWASTTNPLEATGQGLAMAARAGARLTDLEFVQFHPTALAESGDPRPLLTEAVRGAGALLVDGEGGRLLLGRHPDAELAPRDVVTSALWDAMHHGVRPMLDVRKVENLKERFPTLVSACRTHGFDPQVEPVPVVPAAHYHMGGVWTDDRGRSSLPGLWACGEVACTGVHGANRLASNSLLEALVFAARVAHDAAALPANTFDEARSLEACAHRAAQELLAACPSWLHSDTPPAPTSAPAALRHLLWNNVGIVRTDEGLREALAELSSTADNASGMGSDQVLVARLIALAALERVESRGAHRRADHPRTLPAWRCRLAVTVPTTGQPRLRRVPLGVHPESGAPAACSGSAA